MKSNSKVQIGSWITLGHFSIVEIMAEAGFDWLCVDMEHSVIDYYQAEQLIATIQSKGLNAYVRVGENDSLIIKRVLDAGADGVIVPMVNTKSDAIKAVESVYYPPAGKRGVGLARAQKYGFGFEEYLSELSQKKIIAQIEHIDAINHLEDILSVEGIDGTFIGPYDLSASMGLPGQYEHNDVKEAVSSYEQLSKKVDKHMGCHVIRPEYRLVLDKISKGYSFIAFSLDILFLGTICREQMKSVRENLKGSD